MWLTGPNPVAPRAGDDLDRFDAGMRRAVTAATAAGVRRIVLASLPVTSLDRHVDFVGARRAERPD